MKIIFWFLVPTGLLKKNRIGFYFVVHFNTISEEAAESLQSSKLRDILDRHNQEKDQNNAAKDHRVFQTKHHPFGERKLSLIINFISKMSWVSWICISFDHTVWKFLSESFVWTLQNDSNSAGYLCIRERQNCLWQHFNMVACGATKSVKLKFEFKILFRHHWLFAGDRGYRYGVYGFTHFPNGQKLKMFPLLPFVQACPHNLHVHAHTEMCISIQNNTLKRGIIHQAQHWYLFSVALCMTGHYANLSWKFPKVSLLRIRWAYAMCYCLLYGTWTNWILTSFFPCNRRENEQMFHQRKHILGFKF